MTKKEQTILLIEDDVWLAELQARVLEKAGYHVAHAPHATSAISMIDEVHPDAIVLDVLLGASTAFALLHELQSYDDTGKLPVILCTNMAESLNADEMKSYGVRRIVDKSTMVPADLVAAVRSVLL